MLESLVSNFDLVFYNVMEEWCEKFMSILNIQVTVCQSQKIGCVWKSCFVKFSHICQKYIYFQLDQQSPA